jgi:hypothetical protein
MFDKMAITVTAGVLALAIIISMTVLLLNGVEVPAEFKVILSGLTTAGVLGAAITQGGASKT